MHQWYYNASIVLSYAVGYVLYVIANNEYTEVVQTTHLSEQRLALVVKHTILQRRGRVLRGLHSRDR